MFEPKITLSWAEVLVAAHVGVMRHVQSLRAKRRPTAGCGDEDSWTKHIEGAAGEMAVAKYLNVYWNPSINTFKAPDVGGYQVRTNTSRRLDDLILRPGDYKEDDIYISVLSFVPQFILCGWIKGIDGKRDQWLRDGSPGRPQAFFVPRSSLNALEALPPRRYLAEVAV